ncbi:hypothetical protein [Bradyrhizobium sp. USDA 10063]
MPEPLADSHAELAVKLGVDRHAIADAERGKLSTSAGVYVGMLWAMNLLPSLADVADPKNDEEGLALSGLDERERPGRGRSAFLYEGFGYDLNDPTIATDEPEELPTMRRN